MAAARWVGRGDKNGADGAAATMRAHALALTLLERHGVLTRGAVAAERVPGGFAAVYPVLKAMEAAAELDRHLPQGDGHRCRPSAGAAPQLHAVPVASPL